MFCVAVAFIVMHVYVIISTHEHMALLTESNRSNSQQLSCSIASRFVLSLLHVYPYGCHLQSFCIHTCRFPFVKR